MLLCSTDYDLKTEQMHITLAQQNKVDSIILLSYNEGLVIPEGIPMVTIDRNLSTEYPCVTSDNFAGGQISVRKLAELGCKKLLFFSCGSPLPNETTKRGDGFLSACTSLGLEYERLCLVSGTPFSVFEQFIQEHVVDGKLTFDGLICDTDLMAVKIRNYLATIGLSAPDDLQIIGFDGIKKFGSDEEYVCSTVVQQVDKIAQVSVDLALSDDWSKLPPLVCLPVTYAYGGTTRK